MSNIKDEPEYVPDDGMESWQKYAQTTNRMKDYDKIVATPNPPKPFPPTKPEPERFINVLDLHGWSIEAGYKHFVEWLELAKENKCLKVHVITGKSGDMKKLFPSWLSSPIMREKIKRFEEEMTGGSYLLILW